MDTINHEWEFPHNAALPRYEETFRLLQQQMADIVAMTPMHFGVLPRDEMQDLFDLADEARDVT